MSEYKIEKWNDIENSILKSTLILGNGASIAVNQQLNYKSLKEHAEKNGLMNDNVKTLFDTYDTCDFELILRLVWQATNVNEALKIPDTTTKETYEHIRDCLIETVRDIHPTHADIEDQLPIIYQFIKQFKTIISLNYDLILYWTMMYGNNQEKDGHVFKDCFNRSDFVDNWKTYRKLIYGQKACTLVFYPHGNLILARNRREQEQKIIITYEDDLLEEILHEWKSGVYTPLFVCEGTQEQKKNSIKNSFYLTTISKNVLPTLYRESVTDGLVIYGWNIGEQDEHILESLLFSPKKIYISVFNNDQKYCNRVHDFIVERYQKIRKEKPKIIFFDSQSEGCWNNE